MKPSIKVLTECIEVQTKKAQDYQNPASTVKQADYYLNGVQTIYDTMHGKMLRIKSIQETMQNDKTFVPNHESLRDSLIDIINYASFYVAYMENGIPGQSGENDMFNRPLVSQVSDDLPSAQHFSGRSLANDYRANSLSDRHAKVLDENGPNDV